MTAKGFTLYTVYTGGGDASQHFATLAEAMQAAREHADYIEDIVEVEKHETVPITKAALIQILDSSGGSWAHSSEVVARVRPRRKLEGVRDDDDA